jgi:hypothetical protein
MSAPPIAAVVVYPFKKLSRVFAPRQAAAIPGLAGAKVTNAPIVATLVPSKVELRRCRPGRTSGLDDMRPASFKNATIEPVKVTPPIEVSKDFTRVLVDAYQLVPRGMQSPCGEL